MQQAFYVNEDHSVENWHILKHGCFGNLSSILYGLGFIREKNTASIDNHGIVMNPRKTQYF